MTLIVEDKTLKSDNKTGYWALFHNAEFMSLWMAQIFSQFADRAVFVLFVALLTSYDNPMLIGHSIGAAQLTSILYVAFTIPAIVFSPFAGVYVDRWSNKMVLIISNLIRAIFVGISSLDYFKHHIVATLFLAFMISIGSQFFGPAETSSIPRLVKKSDLYSANSLFFTTMMIALGFGFALGEPIISRVGLHGAPWAVASGFVIAAILLLKISDNQPGSNKSDNCWEELRQGLAFIVDNPEVFKAIAKITILFSTIITLNIIAVGLAEQVLHIQAFQFGYIVAAAGLGMGIGNFIVGHYGKTMNSHKLVYSGFIGLGSFMTGLGLLGFIENILMPYLKMDYTPFHNIFMAVALLLSLSIGFTCAMVAVPTQAKLQLAVPAFMRGKVFGAQNTAMSAASTIPVILTGISADNLPGGVSTTLLIMGLPTVIISLYYYLQKNSDSFEENVIN